jgi:murein DD-endopeptidase MepM/ murein hydrolase activator NlpD
MKDLILFIILALLLFSSICELKADSPFRSELVTSSPFLATTGKGGERRNNLHKGWDGYPKVIDGKVDWIVFPIMDGKVIGVGINPIDGKYVKMLADNGLEVKYCHADIIYDYYKVGDYLTTENYIMLMGDSGYTDGNHVHIEVSDKKGKYYDPQEFFPSEEQQFKFRKKI